MSRQAELTANAARCHFTNAPTLAAANAAYGRGTAEAWLTGQLGNLSEFSGARDKVTPEQLDETVRLVASEYHWLNMAEVMLFCRRYKLGRYGKFYGSVDPIAILEGLKEFCRERAEAYCRREQQERQRLTEESRRDACTWQEYLERKGEAPRPSPLCKSRMNDQERKMKQ